MKRIISAICVCVILLVGITGCGASTVETPKHRLQWWLSHIQWDGERLPYTGKGVDIALLDTGVDTAHPDLAGKVISEIKVSGLGKSEQETKDHGTGIAGIIAAYPHDEKGALGVATGVNIISIDVTDNSDGTVAMKNLVDGIEMAISKDVDIISISVGIKEGTDELYRAIKKAYDKGIIIVASAGNNMNNDILYPAAYDEVIAVGSLSKDGKIISPTGNAVFGKVVYLPGENVVSTAPEGKYRGYSGTSFSCGILTGMIAVSLEANDDIEDGQRRIYSKMKSVYGNTVVEMRSFI